MLSTINIMILPLFLIHIGPSIVAILNMRQNIFQHIVFIMSYMGCVSLFGMYETMFLYLTWSCMAMACKEIYM